MGCPSTASFFFFLFRPTRRDANWRRLKEDRLVLLRLSGLALLDEAFHVQIGPPGRCLLGQLIKGGEERRFIKEYRRMAQMA